MGTPNPLMQDLIAAVTAGGLFTRDEAVALLRSVVSDTPDEMPNNVETVITWARAVREKSAVLDVILQLGVDRLVEVRPTQDGDITMRLNLDPDEIHLSE